MAAGKLIINGIPFDCWESFTVSATMSQLGNTWNFSGAVPAEFGINPGDRATVKIEDKTVVNGLVMTVEKTASGNGTLAVEISGTDWAGLLNRCMISRHHTLTNKKIIDTVKELTRGLSFAGEIVPSYLPACDAIKDTLREFLVEPGQVIATAIYGAALRRGLRIWSDDEGAIKIGAVNSTQGAAFSLVADVGYEGTVLESRLSRSIDNGYSSVEIIHQLESDGDGDTPPENIRITKKVKGFPKDLTIPFVGTMDEKGETTEHFAIEHAAEISRSLSKYSCSVVGHGQQGTLWEIGKVCSVSDAFCNVTGLFLITGRTFKFSLIDGSTTDLEMEEIV